MLPSIAPAIGRQRITGAMGAFGKRVKTRREELRMSQGDLAKASGIRQPTISNIETGRNQGSKYAVELAAALRVTPRWLTSGAGQKELKQAEEPSTRLIFIDRHRDVRIGAGQGVEVIEGDIDRIAFREDWLRAKGWNPKALRAASAEGRSMEPRIQHGDLLLFNTQEREVKSGGVYVFKEQNTLRVKRLFKRYDGALRILSDNPAPEFAEEVVPADKLENLEIIGRVIWIGGNV